jgi:hypothetical protein
MSPPIFAYVVSAAVGILLAVPIVAIMYRPILWALYVWGVADRPTFMDRVILLVHVLLTLFSAGSAMYLGYWSSLWLLGY